jgi:hypothetical protein
MVPVRLPDRYPLSFVVIGAARSGTTTLFEHLRSHPDLELPDAKELPYFSHDNRFRVPWDSYAARHFRVADPTKLYGTVTPHFMAGALMSSYPGVPRPSLPPIEMIPARIASVFPDIRLIAILREPVARAIAQCRLMLQLGLEPRSMETALLECMAPEELERARTAPNELNSYVAWGEYDRILQGYLRHFPKDQLLIVSTAELHSQPAKLLSRVFRFIGVEGNHLPNDLGAVHRHPLEGRRVRSRGLITLQKRLLFSDLARSSWRRLPALVRTMIWRRYSNAAYRTGLPNKTRAPAPDLPPELLERLAGHFEPDAQALQKWAGVVPGLASTQALIT